VLQINGNGLTVLPSQLGKLSALSLLWAHDNQIVGTLSTYMCGIRDFLVMLISNLS
jgi:Leucine-rich repeat (LRR) protein